MSYSEEAQTIRRLAVQLQGMERAAAALEAMGPVEEAIAEGRRTIDEQERALASTRALVQSATQELDLVHQEIEVFKREAEKDVDELLARAKNTAAQVVGDASAQAQAIRAGEVAKRDEALSGVVAQIEHAQRELDVLEEKKVAVRREVAEAAEELKTAKEGIAALKQYAQKLAEN